MPEQPPTDPWPSFVGHLEEDPRPVPWILDLQRLAAVDEIVNGLSDDALRSSLRDVVRTAGKELLGGEMPQAELDFWPR